jgi:hypothetical protein
VQHESGACKWVCTQHYYASNDEAHDNNSAMLLQSLRCHRTEHKSTTVSRRCRRHLMTARSEQSNSHLEGSYLLIGEDPEAREKFKISDDPTPTAPPSAPPSAKSSGVMHRDSKQHTHRESASARLQEADKLVAN